MNNKFKIFIIKFNNINYIIILININNNHNINLINDNLLNK